MSADLGLTLGPLEIGILLSSILLGVVTGQVYIYYTKDFDDPCWLRCFVRRILSFT